MKLWDLLEAAQYTQVFSIYTENIYDQNFPIARGTRSEMLAIDSEYGDELLFEHLMDKVVSYLVNKNNVLVVFLKDEYYEQNAQERYPADCVKRWNNLEPDTRPWLCRLETEEYTDEYIKKFLQLKE